MTNEQFDALTKLMRGSPESAANRAARAVLVEGVDQADAMRSFDIARSTVSTTVNRYRNADILVRAAYLPEKERK